MQRNCTEIALFTLVGFRHNFGIEQYLKFALFDMPRPIYFDRRIIIIDGMNQIFNFYTMTSYVNYAIIIKCIHILLIERHVCFY